MPVLYPPPPWAGAPYSQYVELWHGCLKSDVKSLRAGIDPTKGYPASDFGRGFYTSTVKRQARQWAWKRFRLSRALRRRSDRPVVLRFRVPLEALAQLNSLHFVLADYGQDRYWSFVHHCRQSTRRSIRTHGRSGKKPGADWYDVVSGPVAAFWEQRVAMLGSDQVSFHTRRAVGILNQLILSKDPEDFKGFLVRPKRRKGE